MESWRLWVIEDKLKLSTNNLCHSNKRPLFQEQANYSKFRYAPVCRLVREFRTLCTNGHVTCHTVDAV